MDKDLILVKDLLKFGRNTRPNLIVWIQLLGRKGSLKTLKYF